MDFAELPPSKQWAALKYRGEKFAEVWFKPEGEPCGLTFRIPRESFQRPGLDKELTMANLLKAVTLALEEVESWRYGDVTRAGLDASTPDFTSVLPAPSQEHAYLEIHVRLKPPTPADAGPVRSVPEVPAVRWEELEARWKAILGLEASIDSLRMNMESLMAEMEGAGNKNLTVEEKVNALRADVAQWTKEKKRLRDALPKMKDVIHRSVWAMGTPERKRLAALYTEHIQPHVPLPPTVDVLKELDALQKARQILLAQGHTVYQESRTLTANFQGLARTLHNNAAARAKKKRT